MDTANKTYDEIEMTGFPSTTFKFSGAAAVGTLVYFAPFVRTSPPHLTHILYAAATRLLYMYVGCCCVVNSTRS